MGNRQQVNEPKQEVELYDEAKEEKDALIFSSVIWDLIYGSMWPHDHRNIIILHDQFFRYKPQIEYKRARWFDLDTEVLKALSFVGKMHYNYAYELLNKHHTIQIDIKNEFKVNGQPIFKNNIFHSEQFGNRVNDILADKFQFWLFSITGEKEKERKLKERFINEIFDEWKRKNNYD